MKIKRQEYAAGLAYTLNGLTILFPYGANPQFVFGNIVTRISEPERFGAWSTKREREAYITNYYKANVVTEQRA